VPIRARRRRDGMRLRARSDAAPDVALRTNPALNWLAMEAWIPGYRVRWELLPCTLSIPLRAP
jgi:hypothetical protein